jgi:hypothetical protein
VDSFKEKMLLLERRLTLLERAVSRFAKLPEAEEAHGLFLNEIAVAVDDPRIIYSGRYNFEVNAEGGKYLWLGGSGDIQLVLPVIAGRRAVCDLLLVQHPAVRIDDMMIYVDGKKCEYKLDRRASEGMAVAFKLDGTAGSEITVIIAGVKSICPADLGENEDTRQLAFMFLGYKIYDPSSESEMVKVA